MATVDELILKITVKNDGSDGLKGTADDARDLGKALDNTKQAFGNMAQGIEDASNRLTSAFQALGAAADDNLSFDIEATDNGSAVIDGFQSTLEELPDNLSLDLEATDNGSAVIDGFQSTLEELPDNLSLDLEATDNGSAVIDGFQSTLEELPDNLSVDLEATDNGSAVIDGFQSTLEELPDNLSVDLEATDNGSAVIDGFQSTLEELPDNLSVDLEATDNGSAVIDGFQSTLEELPDNLSLDLEATDNGSAVIDGFQSTLEELPDNLSVDLEATDNGSAVIDGFQSNVEGLSGAVENTAADTGQAFGDMADDIDDSSVRGKNSIDDLDSAFQAFGMNTQMMSSVGIAGAIVGAVAASIGAFAQWEGGLYGIQDATGNTEADVSDLGEKLRAMSTELLYGAQSAGTLAQIAAVGAGALRLSADEDILPFTQAVGEIASTTSLSVEQATTVMINLEKTFKQSLEATGLTAASQSEKIASAINAVGSDETFGVIAELANKIGAAGQAFGLSMADVIGFSSTLVNSGVDIGRGSMAIKQLFTDLSTDSRSFADAFKLDAKTLATALETDPKKAIEMVITAMGTMAKTEGPAALAQRLQDLGLGGASSVDVFTRLSTVTGELDTNVKKANEGFQQGAGFQKELADQSEQLNGKWKLLWASIKDMSVSLGEQLNPAVAGVSGALATVATGIADTFRKDKVTTFFDGIVGAAVDLQAVSWTEAFSGLPKAATATVVDVSKLLLDGNIAVVNGIGQVFGQSDLFGSLSTQAGLVGTSLVQSFTDIGADISAEFAKLTEPLIAPFKAAETAIESLQSKVNLLGKEKIQVFSDDFSANAKESEQALAQFGAQYNTILAQAPELAAEYKRVFDAVRQAKADDQPVTAALIRQMNDLKQAVYEFGDEATGHSAFPDLIEAEIVAKAKSAELTGEIAAMKTTVVELGASYEPLAAKIKTQEDAVKAVTTQISRMQSASATASTYTQVQIAKQLEGLALEKQKRLEVLNALQEQAAESGKPYQNAQRELEKLEREVEKAGRDEEQAVARVADARQKAADWLMQQQEKSAAAMSEHLADEAEKNREIQTAQRERAQESLQFITQLSAGAQQRLFAEEDIVAALAAQGIPLDAMQQEQLQLLQSDYQRKAALDAQTASLESQLTTTVSLSDAFQGIGQDLQGIGDAFNIPGLSDFGAELGKLPDIFKNIKDSVGGLGSAFADMKGGIGGLFSGDILGGLAGLVGGFGGITSAFSALSAAWPVVEKLWSGIKGLFVESKSEGKQAAEALQEFVAQNIEGGAELSAAMQTNYSAMGAAGNDFATFLQQTGTTMDATFGGISANWQEGSTAIDLFTQSLVASGVPMDKAPQQALQMMAAFQDMGLSAEESAAKMLEIAEASGMSETQVNALREALGGVTEQMTGTGEEGATTTTIFDDAATASQDLSAKIKTLDSDVAKVGQKMSGAADETANTSGMFSAAAGASDDLSGRIGTLDSAVLNVAGKMSGAAGETANTSGMFDQASGASENLAGRIGALDSAVLNVAGKMSGAAGETANTSGMFDQASGASENLSGRIGALDSAVLNVAGKMSGAASETANTGGMFDQAGQKADWLSGDMDDLSQRLGWSTEEVAALRQMLLDLPEERNIAINLTTTGSVPELARGGRVGALGLAIVNERGAEIAKFPGGSLAYLAQPGPLLGAFPAGTEIIPHARARQLMQQYPNLPRMAEGGTVPATPGGGNTIINLHIHAPVIDRSTVRMIETELRRLEILRT